MNSYRLWEKRTARFVSVVVSVVTLVAAWSFLEYFNASAKLDFEIQYHNINYDTQAILSDFDQYKVELPPGTSLPDRFVRMLPLASDAFKRRENAQMDLAAAGIASRYDIRKELRDAVVFRMRDSVASRTEMPEAAVNNRAFWESEFPQTLDAIADSITYLQAMRIVISRRCVTVFMDVWNSGSIPAKDIDLTLEAPWLLEPRQLLTQAEVNILDIRPGRAVCSVTNSDSYAKIRIPFLEVGKGVLFEITTSMTNLTRNNVFVDFETERTINARRIILFTVVGVAAVYIVPIIFSVVSRGRGRRKSRARKHTTNLEDKSIV